MVWTPGEWSVRPDEQQGTVGSAKSEGVAQHRVDGTFLGRMWHVVEVAVLVRVVQVNGGWGYLVAHGEDGKYGLYRARRPKQVADHGLG